MVGGPRAELPLRVRDRPRAAGSSSSGGSGGGYRNFQCSGCI